MSLPGPGAAFYTGWSGVSIRLLNGAFSFLSARLHVPGKWGVGGSTSGGLLIKKVLVHTSGVHSVCKIKMRI
jgi:hypothetical protein